MELTQLYYFKVVANNQHISKSADELNVSQPAISSLIMRLENELGVKLFDRKNRAIYLNQYGKVFLKYVNSILLQVENAKLELNEMAQQHDNTISIAVTSPQFLQGMETFIRDNTQMKWKQSVYEISEIAQLLYSGEIDLAITSPGIIGEDLVSDILLRDEFMIAVHPHHPLSNKKSISIEELSNEKFILLQKGLPFRAQIDNLFQKLGFIPNIIMECDHYMRREMLNANIGVTVASSSAQFRKLYDPAIRFLHIEGARNTREIVLTRRKNKFITSAAKTFSQYLIDYYGQIYKAEKHLLKKK